MTYFKLPESSPLMRNPRRFAIGLLCLWLAAAGTGPAWAQGATIQTELTSTTKTAEADSGIAETIKTGILKL